MITLTNATVDIADCNVTLRYFSGAGAGTMPFSAAGPYGTLYEQIAEAPRRYRDVCQTEGQILDQLRPFYAANKFWSRYLTSGDIKQYPGLAWSSFVPISATLTERVDVVLPPELAAITVRPEPRVLLYPFGWSTWLSLRITGSYSLQNLAALFSHLVAGAAYRYESKPEAVMNAGQLMANVRAGVEIDAFGGKANVATPSDLLTVTTVLAKHGGGLSLGALTADEEKSLQTLIRPGKPPAQESVKTMSEPLPLGGDPLLDYVLHDDFSWFLWIEHLLKPEKRLFRKLHCYHSNTLRSLLQAWFFQTLFRQAGRTKPWTPEMTALLDTAITLLDTSEGLNDYKNRSLLTFLASDDFKKVAELVRKRLNPA